MNFYPAAKKLGDLLLEKKLLLTTAESCTGGELAGAITKISGCSAWFDRGFVTYSNAAKIEMLKVQPETLAQHGAVSAEVALEMAQGALQHSQADVSISITGIAGPTGGTQNKEVGTVWFGFGFNNHFETRHGLFSGGRSHVRAGAVLFALNFLCERLGEKYV